MTFSMIASGTTAVAFCASIASGDPCASMPTASITESGPRPAVASRTASTTSCCLVESITVTPRARARARRSGTTSEAKTVRAPRWRAIRAAMSPIGPSPSTRTVPPSGMPAYCTACQAVGRTSER
jgi:hypothetical protein